jgi:hypothetical protein
VRIADSSCAHKTREGPNTIPWSAIERVNLHPHEKEVSPVELVKSQPRQDMAVILGNTPPTYHWGWYSREDPRMHLQTVDRTHLKSHDKVWLENKGRRVIEPEPGIPAKVAKTLTAAIIQERERIEIEWAYFMIKSGWLKVKMVGTAITLFAYPNTPNHFERTIDLLELIPNESSARKVTPKQVTLNEEFAFLEIFPEKQEGKRIHEPLPKVLWVN